MNLQYQLVIKSLLSNARPLNHLAILDYLFIKSHVQGNIC